MTEIEKRLVSIRYGYLVEHRKPEFMADVRTAINYRVRDRIVRAVRADGDPELAAMDAEDRARRTADRQLMQGTAGNDAYKVALLKSASEVVEALVKEK